MTTHYIILDYTTAAPSVSWFSLWCYSPEVAQAYLYIFCCTSHHQVMLLLPSYSTVYWWTDTL